MASKQNSDTNSTKIKGDQERAFFNVDSRLLIQLGEQLVTNKAIALAELVKNSYDADANKATVTLINVKKPGGIIIVEDDGVGISQGSFIHNWMRIATIDSTSNPISKKYHRYRSGEKGIGRIACRKIAKKLHFESIYETDEEKKEKIIAIFNWDDFKAGSDVDKIPINYHIENVPNTTMTGTKLQLIDTIGNWTKENVDRLNVELSELYSPNIFEEEEGEKEEIENQDEKNISSDNTENDDNLDHPFKYEIITKEFDKFKENLNTAFFKTAWAKLIGTVDDSGKAEYTLKIQNKYFRLSGTNTLTKDENFQHLRDCNTIIYIFVYYGTNFFENSPWKPGEAAKIGSTRGGVRIYADHFRVFGYGDPDDDWLDLAKERARSLTKFKDEADRYIEEEKRPGLHLPINSRLFGYVNYKKASNPTVQISINREKLDTTESFQELKTFVRLGINYATVLYANEVWKKKNFLTEQQKKDTEQQKKQEEESRKKAEEAKNESDKKVQLIENDLKQIQEKAVECHNKLLAVQYQQKTINVQKDEYLRKLKDLELRAKNNKIKGLWAIVKDERKRIENLTKKQEKLILEENRLKEDEVQLTREVDKKQIEVLSTKGENIEERKKAEQLILDTQIAEFEREQKIKREEQVLYRVLASTGTSLFIFFHEIQTLLTDMVVMNENFADLLNKVEKETQQEYQENYERFNNRIEMIDEFGEFLGLTIGKESRSEMKKWHLLELVGQAFAPFNWDMKEKGIEYTLNIPEIIRTPMIYRSEMFAIILNFLTNSIKALKKSSDRRIEVRATETENEELIIHFLDSGKGLDPERREIVFEPFITDSEADFNYGTGTGLGLKLVQDIVETYNGEVKFIDPPSGWNTCIELKLPQV
jgi:signal transduction histidine kinase